MIDLTNFPLISQTYNSIFYDKITQMLLPCFENCKSYMKEGNRIENNYRNVFNDILKIQQMLLLLALIVK